MEALQGLEISFCFLEGCKADDRNLAQWGSIVSWYIISGRKNGVRASAKGSAALRKKNQMKIATSTVSCEGFGDSAAFESRFAAFKEALEKAKGEGVQLLCLPGGYFCAKPGAEFKKAKNRIVQEAKRTGIAVAVGIDYPQGKRKKFKKNKTPRSMRPSFAVTWNPQQRERSWRQRSMNSEDQWCVSEEDCRRPQTLTVSGRRIEILACGELFNERIRKSIIERHPRAVVDLSHRGQGLRADPSLKLLARQRMYTFCCTHANIKGAMKRAFAPGGHKKSTRKTDSLTTGKPRIEMKMWSQI
jgi:hypothetical protein